jgi:hypothetical protein
MAVGLDRAVREHQQTPLSSKQLPLNVPKEKLRGLLLIGNCACGAQVIPGDLQRCFNDDRKWFSHATATARRPNRFYQMRDNVGDCSEPGDDGGSADCIFSEAYLS